MTINEMVQKAHENAKNKGFHEDEKNNIGELLMLIVSELGEALDAHRSGRFLEKENSKLLQLYSTKSSTTSGHKSFEIFIKDTFEDELADVIIRVGDLCGLLQIDLESHIKAKMRYNKSRPHKHGKLY